MTPDFEMKKGDLLPKLKVTLVDADGDAVDLAGQVGVVFSMRPVAGGAIKIDEQACIIVDEAGGVVEYAWTGTDTNTVGDFDAEFSVDFGGGVTETFPNHRNILVRISEPVS